MHVFNDPDINWLTGNERNNAQCGSRSVSFAVCDSPNKEAQMLEQLPFGIFQTLRNVF